MSHDPGAKELAALLETPSVPLENAIDALGSSLESAHAAETGGVKLPAGALAPITQMHTYYRELQRRVRATETSSPAWKEVVKALTRMEGGLDNLAAAAGQEGDEARQEAQLGADEMERAGGELARALGRLA